jgi:hypothetical protein
MRRITKASSRELLFSAIWIGFFVNIVFMYICIQPLLGTGMEWKVYKNKKYGYQLNFPSGWQMIEAKPREGNKTEWAAKILGNNELQKVTFLEEEPGIWPGEFQICVYSNPERLGLGEWIEKNEPQDITGGSLLQDVSDISLSGKPGKRLSIFGFDHEIIEIVMLYKELIYSLNFAGNNPNDPKQKEHELLYNYMLSTLVFL